MKFVWMMSKEELWAAQLAVYPDSVELGFNELWEIMRHNHPSWIKDNYKDAVAANPKRWDLALFTDEADRRNEWRHWVQLALAEHRGAIARSVACCLMNDPHGVFYACCKQTDGTYLYMGQRFGLDPSEYASPFNCDNITVLGEEE